MLTTLRIKNLALVSDLTIDLRAGYNVVTGETGAGKSILIGALNLVLGERADRGLIRNGTDACTVEAVMDISKIKPPIKAFLEQNGLEPCEEDQLVLKRSLTSTGANRQFINGSPASLSVLAELGEWLVDIHGPHEHQSLLRPLKQLQLLDAFAKAESERQHFTDLLEKWKSLQEDKSALMVDERTYAQQLDLLRFQAKEITDARLDPAEEERLESDYSRASNVSRLIQLGQEAIAVLAENDNAIVNQMGTLGRALNDLRRIDNNASNLVSVHDLAASNLRELQSELSHYVDKLEIDPAAIQQMEDRLSLVRALKRKYGGSVAEVIAFGDGAVQKLASLEQRDAELERLNIEITVAEKRLKEAACALTAKRQKAVPALNKAVTKELAQLGFRQSQFEASLSTAINDVASAAAGGFDAVEFQFAPNPGEPIHPLRAIASSGELARVMLAIKTVLAVVDNVPVLVFDEVDANVGGETATAVGEKMRQIARNRQVLCITHLPQVAAPATNHFVATKQTKAGRTISEINLLGATDRVDELARMLGGQTDAARKHAAAMLGK